MLSHNVILFIFQMVFPHLSENSNKPVNDASQKELLLLPSKRAGFLLLAVTHKVIQLAEGIQIMV